MQYHIQTEILINAPAATVWQVISNLQDYSKWNPFMISVEGKLEKGERLKVVLKNDNKLMRFKPVVKKVKPFTSFSWLGSLFIKGLFDGYHYFKLEEQQPGITKLTHGEKFSGILSRFIFSKIGDTTRENFTRMNKAIKKTAEKDLILITH